jgi:hypothetical protein
MTPRIQASRGSGSPERHVEKLDLSHTDVLLICNDDRQLAEKIASKLRSFGARSIDQVIMEEKKIYILFIFLVNSL